MKYNKELLDKFLNGTHVVAVRTSEEWATFMQLLEDETDCKWDGYPTKPTEYNDWDTYAETSCIAYGYAWHGELTYGTTYFYEEHGAELIEFSDLIKQDLRELLKVGYLIEYSEDGCFVGKEILDERWYNEHMENYGCELTKTGRKNEIIAIYRPKYNGILTIDNPEWALVWEREEVYYTLELPNSTHDNRFLSVRVSNPNDYTFRKKNKYVNRGLEVRKHFTQEEIDALPYQDLIGTLDKKKV